MKYREFGKENTRTVILLHGGGLSWWNYRREAEILQQDYHVVLPVLDGHAGSDRHFTTIEDNAAEVISFINTNFNGKVYLIGGLSIGAQVLLEMLSQKGDICEHAIIESAMVIPSKVTHALIKPSLFCSYGLIRQKWFSKIQFRSLKINDELFDDYYRDTCSVEKADMIAFLQANTMYSLKSSLKNCSADVHIYFGEKETCGIIDSAKIIKDTIPNSTCHELPGMVHGEFSINHAEAYVKAIETLYIISHM